MANEPFPRRRILPEFTLAGMLLAAAVCVVAMVLFAESEFHDAQVARADQVRALAADRAILELHLAMREPRAAPLERALADARSLLADDPKALALLDRVVAAAGTPPEAGMEASNALAELRSMLGASASAAAEAARQDIARARGISLAAGVLLVSVILGTVAFLAAEYRRRRRMATRLEREANHDALTLLPNRRFFLEWLGYAVAQAKRDGTEIALLYIDLDGFKAVNDRHGHRRGDAVLAALAERLRASKRESDLLARLGGDEFALAAPKARDGREVAALGERLLAALADPAQPKLADVPLGASIGIAFFPDDATDVPGLIAAADSAMYAAKRGGKNRVTFHATSPAY